MDIKDLQKINGELFRKSFGRTSLNDRVDDIFDEALEVKRFSDINHLKEEAGDLGCSLLALCDELGVSFEELILAGHEKIKRREAQYLTMGRKLNVALLGGSFNPIHKGHISAAKTILKVSKEFDEVWLLPCNNSLYGKELASADHRIAMCEAAIDDPRIKVCDFEVANELKGSTLHLITKITDDPAFKDQYSFSFVIGADNALRTDEWVGWDELERRCRFVVLPRPGQEIPPGPQWFLKPPHMFLSGDEQLEISSTEIRDALINQDEFGEPALEFLDEKVYQYIKENNLYSDYPTD